MSEVDVSLMQLSVLINMINCWKSFHNNPEKISFMTSFLVTEGWQVGREGKFLTDLTDYVPVSNNIQIDFFAFETHRVWPPWNFYFINYSCQRICRLKL